MGRWYQSIECDPGITKEALYLLKEYASIEKTQGRIVFCQLLFDEIYISTQIQKIGDKTYGNVNLGTSTEDSPATQILTFMVVSVDLKWKAPVGYFPINTLKGPQKAGIIEKVIHEIEKMGVIIVGLTFDGAKVNFKAMKEMGVDLYRKQDVYCLIPNKTDSITFPKTEIYIYPDPCHMLKCVRNTFGEYDMWDNQGRLISFRFVEELLKLQTAEGLSLGNRLKENHVHFGNEIMNVQLAAQVLSRSVADALDICRNRLQLPEFSGSEGTSNFLRIFNNVFDILNSRNSNHAG